MSLAVNKKILSVNFVFIILASLAFGAVFFAMPRVIDDYWFMNNMQTFGTDADGSFSWFKGVSGTAIYHHLYDNSRLPNLLGGLIAFLPLSVTALISTVCIGLTLWFMQTLSGRNSLLSLTALVTAYTFIVPWYDSLFERFYTYNYVWAGAIMLVAVYLFLRQKPVGSVWTFLIGLLLGVWHEIFAFPTLAGFIVCLALNRKMIRKDRMWLCAGVFIGCVWLYLSPSSTADTGVFSMFTPRHVTKLMALRTWFPVLFVVCEAICIAWPRLREYALRPIPLIALTVSTVCVTIYLFIDGGRVLMPSVLIDAVAFVGLFGRYFNAPPVLKKVVCAGLWIFFFLHMGSAFSVAQTIRDDEQKILALYDGVRNTNDGMIYFAPASRNYHPRLALGKPLPYLYATNKHAKLVGEYFNGPIIKLMPPSLRCFRKEMGSPLPANPMIYVYQDYAIGLPGITDSRFDGSTDMSGFIVYKNGNEIRQFKGFPFIGADSCTYYYMEISPEDIELALID